MKPLNLPLPTPKTIRNTLPLPKSTREEIEGYRKTIEKIQSGQDSRFLLVVGPCSVHSIEGARTYAKHLKQLAKEVEKSFFICMRVYCEKPRSALGWKGLINAPDLTDNGRIDKGLTLTRELFLELAEMGVPIATEFLDPLTADYFEDCVTWGSIGARTCASQVHRQLASRLSMPVGFKNDVHGGMDSAVNGMLSASAPHHFMGIDHEGKVAILRSNGNPNLQLVLRGGVEGSNYSKGAIAKACQMQLEAGFTPSILVDCAHGNALHAPGGQVTVFKSVVHDFIEGAEGLIGAQIESYLDGGKQKFEEGDTPHERVSITDPCLSWEETASLIRWASQKLLPCSDKLMVGN